MAEPQEAELLDWLFGQICGLKLAPIHTSLEATATGNMLMQMIALGHVSTLAEARQVVRESFALTRFEPGNHEGWDRAYARLACDHATGGLSFR